MDSIVEEIVEILKVLANPIRLKISALCLVKEGSSKELRETLYEYLVGRKQSR